MKKRIVEGLLKAAVYCGIYCEELQELWSPRSALSYFVW